jgi:C1A family cysteine protease
MKTPELTAEEKARVLGDRPARRYGWIPDLPDKRDFYLSCSITADLPLRVDLRGKCPPVYDQGKLGSCTANAIGAAHQFEQIRQGKSRGSFAPSRLFVYYNERAMEGTIPMDSGALIRDGIKSVVKQGVCPETEWPYIVERFTSAPTEACYKHALSHQALAYRRVYQSLPQLRACLAAGFPVVFGFTVYESFESRSVARAGVVPMPGRSERALGGHAVLAVGYDHMKRWFIVRNSWGTKWGDKGYCYMPYEYVADSDLAADFWTITLVEQ